MEQFFAQMLNFLDYPESMYLAVVEALKCETYPNPKVGAVLLDKDNKLKALGHHKGKGTNHAEIEILNKTNIVSDDTLYVSLEPCFHTDTSPSCADELLDSNLKNIVIGDIDTDLRTNGKSINKLQKAGLNITIIEGVNNFINPNYNKKNLNDSSITYIGKIATSINNKITNNDDTDRYITNSKSLQLTHLLRATVDGILIGKNTLINDNPKLNIRHPSLNSIDIEKYILWGNEETEIRKYAEQHIDKIFITNFDNNMVNVQNIENLSFLNLDKFLKSQKINSLLVEGGNTVHKYLIKSNSYDYFYKFISDNHINNGLSFDLDIDSYLENNLSLNRKIRLNNNSLHIYN